MIKKNIKIFILLIIIIVPLLYMLIFHKQLQSTYIFDHIGSYPEIQTYTDNNYQTMKIIGEDYNPPNNMMQIDGFIDGERKKIFATYTCKFNIWCSISFLSIYDNNQWKTIYGEDGIFMIEDRGNQNNK